MKTRIFSAATLLATCVWLCVATGCNNERLNDDTGNNDNMDETDRDPENLDPDDTLE